MFDIGWSELFLIGIVALIVIGPKDLPLAMRTVARFVRKVRGLSHEFHNAMSEVMREAELDELKRKMQAAAATDLGDKVRDVVDPTGSLVGDFDPSEFAERLKRDVEGGPPARRAAAPAAPATPAAAPATPASAPVTPAPAVAAATASPAADGTTAAAVRAGDGHASAPDTAGPSAAGH
jgi:sec-independent protein translocase protein TatB